MKKQIRRLRLRPGDAVVVRDWQVANALAGLKIGKFPVPIVIAPEGLKRVGIDYLRRLLAHMELGVAGAARSAE